MGGARAGRRRARSTNSLGTPPTAASGPTRSVRSSRTGTGSTTCSATCRSTRAIRSTRASRSGRRCAADRGSSRRRSARRRRGWRSTSSGSRRPERPARRLVGARGAERRLPRRLGRRVEPRPRETRGAVRGQNGGHGPTHASRVPDRFAADGCRGGGGPVDGLRRRSADARRGGRPAEPRRAHPRRCDRRAGARARPRQRVPQARRLRGHGDLRRRRGRDRRRDEGRAGREVLQGSPRDVRRRLDRRRVDRDAEPLALARRRSWALQAGKHVYVEKPISHNVREGRRSSSRRAPKTGSCPARHAGALHERDPRRDRVAPRRRPRRGAARDGLCYKRRKSIGKVDGPQTAAGDARLRPLDRPGGAAASR